MLRPIFFCETRPGGPSGLVRSVWQFEEWVYLTGLARALQIHSPVLRHVGHLPMALRGLGSGMAEIAFALQAGLVLASKDPRRLAAETLGHRSVPIQMSHTRKYKA